MAGRWNFRLAVACKSSCSNWQLTIVGHRIVSRIEFVRHMHASTFTVIDCPILQFKAQIIYGIGTAVTIGSMQGF